MITYFDVLHEETILKALTTRHDSLKEAQDSLASLQTDLAPILRQIAELAEPGHELSPEERTIKMQDLQKTESELRRKAADIQTEHGHYAHIDTSLEHLEPEIVNAKKRWKQAKMGYGRTVKNLTCSRTERDLQETKQLAQQIASLVAELAKLVPLFWEAHARLREGATNRGAKLNMGAGVGLDAKRVDGVLHAMLWPIFERSMHNVRPGPGIMDLTLTDLFPSSVRQYLGEPEQSELPKKPAKKNAESGGLVA
jgi:hypothetical protein